VSHDGLLVTNYHVIRGGASAAVRGGDGRPYLVLGAVAVAPEADLALLKVSTFRDDVPHLSLSSSTAPAIGSRVFAIGNPLGLTNTLSDGLVSGMRELPGFKGTLIQTSAPISPGSSGGPLLSNDGTVVGVTSAGITDGQNLNFAVPAEHVRQLIDARGKTRPLSEVSPPLESSIAVADVSLDGESPTKKAPPKSTAPLPKLPLDAAEVLVGRRDYAGAMAKLRDLGGADQNSSRYWLLLGRVQEEGFFNLDVAEDAYRRAIKLSSKDKQAHERLGLILARRGRFAQAIDAYREMAKVDPKDPAGYIGAGCAALGLRNYDQALAFFDWGLKLTPQSPTLHELRGMTLYQLKRDDEALTAFKTALGTDPKSIRSLGGIGDVHFRAGRLANAKSAYLDVLRFYPASTRAHLQLGRIAQREGDMDAARAEWGKAALSGPNTPEGREAIDRLAQVTPQRTHRVR